MPNRIIREGLVTSERINSISMQAEVLFYRLLVTADDYGRFDARVKIILPRVFPLRLDEVTAGDVETWLNELEKADLITLYEVEGKPYLCINRWKQRNRAIASKYPQLPPKVNTKSTIPVQTDEYTTDDGQVTDKCQTDDGHKPDDCQTPDARGLRVEGRGSRSEERGLRVEGRGSRDDGDGSRVPLSQVKTPEPKARTGPDPKDPDQVKTLKAQFMAQLAAVGESMKFKGGT